MKTFSDYLREVARGFDSQRALADALGITPQRLSRALAGDGQYSFNTDNCLRLAKIAQRPAGEVLRAAGKDDVAALLEFLFPKAGKPTITSEQRELLDDWDDLAEDERKAFRLLVHGRVAHRKQKPA